MLYVVPLGQGWEFAHSFSSKLSVFCKKSERPEQFTHGCWFLVCHLSKSLTVAHFWWATWAIHSHGSLKKRERANFKKLIKNSQKHTKKYDFIKKKFEGIARFLWAKEQKNDWFAHSSWATWVIRSWPLICSEQSEQIAHSCSFDLSNLSKSVNEWWANEQIPTLP